MVLLVLVGFLFSIATSVGGTILALFLKLFAPVIDYVATHHRPLAVVFVVLPLSFVLRNVMSVRDYLYEKFVADSTMEGHEKRVQRVVSDVQARLKQPESERQKLCTARAPWQNLSTRFADYKKNSNCVFVGDFRNVLHMSEDQTTVTLEPLVDVGMITTWLLPKGFMLATTLEIEEATIGGLACAVGMTTASHK